MEKLFTKLVLIMFLCASVWQISSVVPVQAEELSINYAQADQVDKTKVTELTLPKEGDISLIIATIRRTQEEANIPEAYQHYHTRNPLYQYPNLKRILVEEGSSQYECRDGVLYAVEKENNKRHLLCVPMNYEGVVHIAKDVVGIISPALDQCEKVTGFEVEEGNPYYYSKNGVLYENRRDYGICLRAYPAGKRDTKFTIPSEVQYMNDGAFANNKYLKEVEFVDEVNAIPAAAFENCTSLEQIINIPDELRGIGNCAFEGCEKLQLFDLPKELTSISGHAFEGIPPVKKIVFPSKCMGAVLSGLKMADGGVMEVKGPWMGMEMEDIPQEGNFIFKGYKETALYKTMKKMSNVTCKPYKKSLYKHKTKKIKKGVKGKGKPSTSWYKKKKKVLYIKTPDQLAGMQKLCKKGIDFKGKRIVLKRNLDMSCYRSFEPIGYNAIEEFKGTFDGNGKTIYNLSIHRYDYNYVGLFSALRGTVKDLQLKGTNVYGRRYVGGIAGNVFNGQIKDCKVSGTVKGYSHVNIVGMYFWDSNVEFN